MARTEGLSSQMRRRKLCEYFGITEYMLQSWLKKTNGKIRIRYFLQRMIIVLLKRIFTSLCAIPQQLLCLIDGFDAGIFSIVMIFADDQCGGG